MLVESIIQAIHEPCEWILFKWFSDIDFGTIFTIFINYGYWET